MGSKNLFLFLKLSNCCNCIALSFCADKEKPQHNHTLMSSTRLSMHHVKKTDRPKRPKNSDAYQQLWRNFWWEHL